MAVQNGKKFTICWRLALVVLLVFPVSLLAPVSPAEAGGFFSKVIPFAGLIGALHARNRIYRTANAYIDEKNELYDRYRQKAREQLANREISGLRDSQVSAYVKVVGLLEGERTAMQDYAESEKRAAREQFLDQVEQTIVNRIMASTAATQVLGALTKGLNSSQDFIDRALDKLAGGGGGAMAEVQRVREIAGKVSMVGGLIGGNTGAELQSIGNRVAELINRPTAEIQAGLEQVQGELGELNGYIEDLKARGVTLTPSEVGREATITLVTGEDPDPEIAAIVNLLTGRAGIEDGTFRSRAREALIQGFVVRCAQMRRRLQEAIAALQSEDSAVGTGERTDLCTQINMEKIAREVAEEGQASSEQEAGEIAESSSKVSGGDLCTLLPVSSDVIEQNSEYACVAIIDQYIGCDGCNNRMSISRMDSAEMAQESAVNGSCGNPGFFTREETPIGQAGYGCINISGEGYRQGVAQQYYYVVFSYGPYVTNAVSGYPGTREIVLGMAQEVINRIDQLPPDFR